MKQIAIGYLESEKHRKEFVTISNKYTVTDARNLLFDGVFNWYWCHVLTSRSDKNLCQEMNES